MELQPFTWHTLGMRMEILRKWLTDQIRNRRVAQGALAKAMGMSDSELSRFLSGKRKQLTVDEIAAAAEFLESDLPEEIFVRPKIYVKKAPLRGVISAGVLRAEGMEAKASLSAIPYIPTEEFAHLSQYAYEIGDTHAEDYAPANSYVLFVDFNEARGAPLQDDIVRIEQSFLISGRLQTRHIVETTLRRVDMSDGQIMLRSLSQDPNIQDLIYDPADTSLVIRDLAIGYTVLKGKMRGK